MRKLIWFFLITKHFALSTTAKMVINCSRMIVKSKCTCEATLLPTFVETIQFVLLTETFQLQKCQQQKLAVVFCASHSTLCVPHYKLVYCPCTAMLERLRSIPPRLMTWRCIGFVPTFLHHFESLAFDEAPPSPPHQYGLFVPQK